MNLNLIYWDRLSHQALHLYHFRTPIKIGERAAREILIVHSAVLVSTLLKGNVKLILQTPEVEDVLKSIKLPDESSSKYLQE